MSYKDLNEGMEHTEVRLLDPETIGTKVIGDLTVLNSMKMSNEITQMERMLKRSLDCLALEYPLITKKSTELKKGCYLYDDDGDIKNFGFYCFIGEGNKEMLVGLTLEGSRYMLSATSGSEVLSKDIIDYIVYISEFNVQEPSFDDMESLEQMVDTILHTNNN